MGCWSGEDVGEGGGVACEREGGGGVECGIEGVCVWGTSLLLRGEGEVDVAGKRRETGGGERVRVGKGAGCQNVKRPRQVWARCS